MTSKLVNSDQIRIFQNDLTSAKLKSLSEKDLHNALLDVWSEVKLATGAKLHDANLENGKLLDLQLAVLLKFITRSPFIELTVADLTTAFYMNAAGHEWKTFPHYGKEINVEWVGQVVGAYWQFYRKTWAEHGDSVLRAIAPPPPPKPVRHIPESFWQQEIQKDLETFRKKGIYTKVINASHKYCYLRKIGCELLKIKNRRHWQKWMNDTANHIVQHPSSNDPDLVREIEGEMKGHRRASAKARRAVVFEFRKHSYLYFLQLMYQTAIVNIWQDIDFLTPLNNQDNGKA